MVSPAVPKDSNKIPLVFLKQFPAADDGDQACYQAVIETAIQVQEPVDVKLLLGNYRVRVFASDMHPFARDLGLTDMQEATAGFEVRCNAILEKGRAIWQWGAVGVPKGP